MSSEVVTPSTPLPPATAERPASPDLKQTPLHATHVRLGGKMVGFGGWSMPVQYPSGILTEHRAVRQAAGVFDISHMGQFIVSGPGGKAWLNSLFTNDLHRLKAGQSQYGFLLNERGGVIDDLIIYEYAEGEFLLVVNASKIEEDFAWLQAHLPPPDAEGDTAIELSNRSDRFAALAVQGPRAAGVLAAYFGPDTTFPERFGVKVVKHEGLTYVIARTGYTGEDGFEWFFPARASAVVWDDLLAAGAPLGLIPCGLGSRDSLRLEVCYPLNGSDLSADRSPVAAGLGIFVDLEKPAFVGRDVLLQQKADGGPTERLAAFRMTEKSPPPRPHYAVYAKDGDGNAAPVGETTSGGLSPSLDAGIGMAYLPAKLAKAGTPIEIDIRGKRYAAVVEKKPLYKRRDDRFTPAGDQA